MKSKLDTIFNNLGIKLFHKHVEESYQFDFLKCVMDIWLEGRYAISGLKTPFCVLLFNKTRLF